MRFVEFGARLVLVCLPIATVIYYVNFGQTVDRSTTVKNSESSSELSANWVYESGDEEFKQFLGNASVPVLLAVQDKVRSRPQSAEVLVEASNLSRLIAISNRILTVSQDPISVSKASQAKMYALIQLEKIAAKNGLLHLSRNSELLSCIDAIRRDNDRYAKLGTAVDSISRYLKSEAGPQRIEPKNAALNSVEQLTTTDTEDAEIAKHLFEWIQLVYELAGKTEGKEFADVFIEMYSDSSNKEIIFLARTLNQMSIDLVDVLKVIAPERETAVAKFFEQVDNLLSSDSISDLQLLPILQLTRGLLVVGHVEKAKAIKNSVEKKGVNSRSPQILEAFRELENQIALFERPLELDELVDFKKIPAKFKFEESNKLIFSVAFDQFEECFAQLKALQKSNVVRSKIRNSTLEFAVFYPNPGEDNNVEQFLKMMQGIPVWFTKSGNLDADANLNYVQEQTPIFVLLDGDLKTILVTKELANVERILAEM